MSFHVVDNLRVGICEQCGGAWFGSGQLDSVVKHGAAALDALISLEPAGPHAEHAGGEAKCPLCDIVLQPFAYNGQSAVHVSACSQCGGVFIDANSLTALNASAQHRSDVGASSFGHAGGFTHQPFAPTPQGRVQSISQNLFHRQRYNDYQDPSYAGQGLAGRAMNTMVIADIAMDVLSLFL